MRAGRGVMGPLGEAEDSNQRVESEHREGQRQLQGGADDQAQSRAQPSSACVFQLAAVAEFARHRARERPQENSGQAKEEAHERANARAKGGPTTRSESACSESTGREVDDVGEKREQREKNQASRPDILEIIGPRGQQKTQEDERGARQSREYEPRQADDDEGGGEQVKKNRRGFQDMPQGPGSPGKNPGPGWKVAVDHPCTGAV